MKKCAVYSVSCQVGLSDVDFSGRLRLSGLFDYLQDAATQAAAEQLRSEMKLLDDLGLARVVLRMRADVVRYPVWDEAVTVSTWLLPASKYEFERHSLVLDAAGEPVARAVATWALIDTKKRRLRRCDQIAQINSAAGERAIDSRLSKLQSPAGELVPVYQRNIGYSDIDLNGHLNNSRYVDFVMDCFRIEDHRRYQATSIEINFVNEALPRDTILLRKEAAHADGGSIYVEGVNEAQDQVVFRSLLHIVPR